MPPTRRPPRNRRSWLFLAGAERDTLLDAPRLGADVLIQELEDFTPPERRPQARAMAPEVLEAWREAGVVSAVRINPFETCGEEDLEAVMRGRPDVVMMSKVVCPEQVRRLEEAIAGLEARNGIEAGSTEIVPNVETAAGLVRTYAIATVSPRLTAALVAAEDMAADLDAERTREGTELAYPRSRFLLECVAAGVVAIDCPYTFSDLAGAEADLIWARRIGYKAKSIVNPGQVGLVGRIMTPSDAERTQAGRVVSAFEAARGQGLDRAEVDGLMVEVPTYLAAKRLLTRAAELG